jgi:hypothetical protein
MRMPNSQGAVLIKSWATILLLCVCLFSRLAFGQNETGVILPGQLSGEAQPRSETTAPPIEKLESFDENTLELRLGQDGWQLWAGLKILKDFGKKEQDARTVLKLIRELHLDSRGRLGAPHAVAEYWLSKGAPPQAAPQGARTLSFDPMSLSVEQVSGQWLLRDRLRALITFGNNEAEARRALAVLAYYHFDRVGYVGEPTPTFMYFLARNDAMQRSESVAHQALRALPGDAKPIHIVNGAKAADPKRNDIDPRKNSPLLPPGRQLIQVSSVPGQANMPDRQPFNWQKAQLRQVGDSWELASQDLTITRFGTDDALAREALALLRHYHFTELCMVGGDEPCFSFLLVNGRMPRELRFGVANVAFHPERVQISKTGNSYSLEQDGVCLCNLGPRKDAAEALRNFIRQENPDHLCWVGSDPQHGMAFFVRNSLAPFNTRNDGPAKP